MSMSPTQKRLYAKAKKAGICVGCRKRKATRGLRCDDCADQQRATSAVRRKRRKRKGLCIVCGRRKSVAGKTRCKDCAHRDATIRTSRKKKGLCRSCGASTDGKSRCERCRTMDARSRAKLKDEVFARYGGYRCSCCGETHREFLTIDHIDGDGTAHRRKIGGNMYYWLKRSNYPTGFRVLCMNCNWAIGVFGHCPHEGVNAATTAA